MRRDVEQPARAIIGSMIRSPPATIRDWVMTLTIQVDMPAASFLPVIRHLPPYMIADG